MNKKRLLAWVMMLVMMLTLVPTTVLADSGVKAELTVSEIVGKNLTDKIESGDVIVVSAKMTENSGFCAAGLSVGYDEAKLTLTKIAKGEGMPGTLTTEGAKLLWDHSEDYRGVGAFLEFTFSVNAGVADGDTVVTLQYTTDEDDVSDYNEENVAFSATPCTLTISGGVTPPQHTCSADTLTEIPAKAHTCTEDGNYKYYRCTCGELYEDADAKIPTTAEKVIDKAGHTDLMLYPAKEPTCDKDGCVAYWFCTGCNNYYFDNNGAVGKKTTVEKVAIPATGHKWVLVVGGYEEGATQHTVKCSVCGQKKDEAHADRPGDKSDKWESDKDNHWNVYGCGTIMNKAAHTWNEGVVTKGATCTEPGEKTFTCAKCGYEKTETIPVIAHQYEWKHDETNHWQECSVCHDIIDKAEHTYASHKCEDTATCTKAECGYVKPAGQHSWNDGEVTTPATCTTDGVKTYTCKVCSETKTEPIKASGHSLTKVEAVAATCTEGGNNEYYTCSVCKKVFKADKTTETTVADETLAALGHKLTKTPAKAATCTEPGNNEYWTCSVCNKVFKADKTTETTVVAETLAALGHKMTKTPAKPATCAAEGNNEYYTCSVCNKVFKDEQGNTLTTVAAETLAKDPANHTGGKELRGAVAASCMTAGRTDDTYCKGCGKLTKAGDLIPPTGNHNYVDGVCTTCGSKQPADNATIKAAIEKVVADVKEAVEEVLDKAIENETDANTKEILKKLKGYVSGSSRSKLQAVYSVTMSLNGQDLGKGDSLADGQNVTIAISEETYNALKSGAKIVESYLDKDGNAQTREINATLKQVGGGYTVTFASDKTAVYGLMTRTSSGGSSGSGSSYTSGQSFTTDLPADSITRVTVNGKKLDSKYYTVSSNGSGSIVTLTDAYLATLKAGKYTVKIENKTHVSTGTFTIKADGTLSSPKTADAGIALYAMLAVSSLMGTAVVSKKRRKA